MVDTSKKYDYDPRNLPKDVLEAIGLMSACASFAQSTIEDAIGGCVRIDFENTGAIVTHMTMPLRYSVLKSVAEIAIDDLDDLDELDCLIENVKDALDERNAYAHHLLCRDPDTNEVFMRETEARTRYELNLTPISVDEIKTSATYLYWAGIDLFTFFWNRDLLPIMPASIRPRHHKSSAARKQRRKALRKKRGLG